MLTPRVRSPRKEEDDSPKRRVQSFRNLKIVAEETNSPRRQTTIQCISPSIIDFDRNLGLLVVDLARFIDADTISELYVDLPEGVNLFRLLMHGCVPHKLLTKYIEKEINNPDKTLVFRDDQTPGSQIVIEYIRSQCHLDQIILEGQYVNKWAPWKITLEPKTNDLLEATTKAINDIDKLLTFLDQSVVYLCQKIYQVARTKKEDGVQMVMTVLFLRIIVPTIFNAHTLKHKKSSRMNQQINLIRIAKLLQSIVSATVTGLKEDELTTIDMLASYSPEVIKPLQEKLISMVKKVVKNSTVRENRIMFSSVKFEEDDALKVLITLGELVRTEKISKITPELAEKAIAICNLIDTQVRYTNLAVSIDYRSVYRDLGKFL